MLRRQGFTLFEIIIVVLIIGIIATFALLRFTSIDEDREIRLFAETLTHKLILANQVAQLLPAELGFDIQQSYYQFYQLDLSENEVVWRSVDDTHLLKPQAIPHQIQITVESDPSRLIALNEQHLWTPPIQFFANGQLTPFQINIHKQGDTQAIYTITANLSGAITLQ